MLATFILRMKYLQKHFTVSLNLSSNFLIKNQFEKELWYVEYYYDRLETFKRYTDGTYTVYETVTMVNKAT